MLKKVISIISLAILSGSVIAKNIPIASASIISQPRIVGGADAAITQTPWQVQLEIGIDDSDMLRACGGTLIADRWVITAAHCVKSAKAEQIIVYSGNSTHFMSSAKKGNSVRQLILHPKYIKPVNDIALLELKATPSAPAQPIRLMDTAMQVDADFEFESAQPENLFLSGWGRTNAQSTQSTQTLQKVIFDGVSDEQCAQAWGWTHSQALAPYFICANKISKGACAGDSGGPLVWQDKSAASDADKGYRLAGVVSFGGKECANNALPDVYTQVSSYRTWIESHITDYQIPEPYFSYNIFDIDYSKKTQPTADKKAGSFGSFILVIMTVLCFVRKKYAV